LILAKYRWWVMNLALVGVLLALYLYYEYLTKNGDDFSLVSVKRALSRLESEKILEIHGSGPATSYSLTEYGKLVTPIDASVYTAIDPDKRYGAKSYNAKLFSSLTFHLFSSEEKKILEDATEYYRTKSVGVSETIYKKELERFVIELSWKSSKIEGNTYTLLETENLILKDKEAEGKSEGETKMILNHKSAFSYIFENREQFKELTRRNVEDVHRLLVENLDIQNNFRAKPVGISGSIYRPLDNQYQIAEAVDALSVAIGRTEFPYAKAFMALFGISYIQPFEDGNKRTSRLMTNAILLAHGLSAISYRSVDEKTYRDAVLVFYELNSLVPLKKIFIEQYDFAARNYLL